MPTPTKGPRLGGGPAHERLILANLTTALFEHGRIKTTQAKAKRVRPLAERMITFAKRGDLASRRRVMTVVRDKSVVHELFTEIAPRYANRQGGYTRIVKLEPRKGDNAPMALIELVEELDESTTKQRSAKPAKKAAAKPAKKTAAAAAEPIEAAVDEAAVEEAEVDTIEADATEADTAEAEVEQTPVAETEAEEAGADDAASDEAASDAGDDEAKA